MGEPVHTTNGDVTSILFNGKQLQDSSKFSQLSSGLGKEMINLNIVPPDNEIQLRFGNCNLFCGQ